MLHKNRGKCWTKQRDIVKKVIFAVFLPTIHDFELTSKELKAKDWLIVALLSSIHFTPSPEFERMASRLRNCWRNPEHSQRLLSKHSKASPIPTKSSIKLTRQRAPSNWSKLRSWRNSAPPATFCVLISLLFLLFFFCLLICSVYQCRKCVFHTKTKDAIP